MDKVRLDKLMQAHIDEVLEARKFFHKNPELAWNEHETRAYIIKALTGHGIECRDFHETTVIGLIYGGKPGKTVALRADMDALPVDEVSGCAYPSENEGRMHACGHDMHMSGLLGAAFMLNDIKEELCGNIVLIFQPAEEAAATVSGAQTLAEMGLLEKYQVDAIFATHVFPSVPLGQVGICSREMMAGVDVFKLKIHGKGGHLSTPHNCRSALYPAIQFMNQLSVLKSQAVNPFDTAIIDTGYFHCGTAENIIPAEAEIIGNVRAYNDDLRVELKRRMENLVLGLELQYDVNCEYEHRFGYDSLVNDPEMADVYRKACGEVFGADNVIEPEPSMGSEDFAFFLKRVKGAFSWIGVGDDKTGSNPLHNGSFFPDEKALPLAMEMLANIAITFLKE